MSQWTHVAGVFRIDHVVIRESHADVFKKLQIWLDVNLPYGSEGPLQYALNYSGDEGPGHSSAWWGELTFWGDLRDFDDVNRINKWVNTVCERLETLNMYLRQALYEIDVEFKSRQIYILNDDQKFDVIELEVVK